MENEYEIFYVIKNQETNEAVDGYCNSIEEAKERLSYINSQDEYYGVYSPNRYRIYKILQIDVEDMINEN